MKSRFPDIIIMSPSVVVQLLRGLQLYVPRNRGSEGAEHNSIAFVNI